MSEAGRLYPPEGMPPLGPPAWPPPPPPPPPPTRRWWIPVIVVGVLVLAIGAVVAIAQLAGDDGDQAADPPPRRSTPSATGRPPTVEGEFFTDPQGTYTMTLGSSWADQPSAWIAEVESWSVADATRGFTPNVNVLTQKAPGLDADQYMELSLRGLDSIDGDVIDQAFVDGANGNSLGLIEYVAQPQGVRAELHFVAVFELHDGTAVVATFTAMPEQFDELWPAVEPYLLSLEATR